MQRFPKMISDEDVLKKVYKIVKKYLPNAEILVYGSYVNGKFTDTSDIDIMIKDSKKIDPYVFELIKDEVEELPTMRIIEIFDYFVVSQTFQEIVNATAKNIQELL